jgi:hypothetical protein
LALIDKRLLIENTDRFRLPIEGVLSDLAGVLRSSLIWRARLLERAFVTDVQKPHKRSTNRHEASNLISISAVSPET